MIRSKWLKLKYDSSLTRIARKLHDFSFENNSDYGFEVNSVRDDCISFKYIQKCQYEDFFLNRFGEQESIVITKFFHVYIDMFDTDGFDGFFIRLANPPKSTKVLYKALDACFGGSLYYESLSFDAVKLVGCLLDDARVTRSIVSSISVSGVSVNRSAKANIDVQSDENAIEDLRRMIGNTYCIINKIKIRLSIDNAIGLIEVRSNGVVVHPEIFSGYISDSILKYEKEVFW